jgi:hypothetical protein
MSKIFWILSEPLVLYVKSPTTNKNTGSQRSSSDITFKSLFDGINNILEVLFIVELYYLYLRAYIYIFMYLFYIKNLIYYPKTNYSMYQRLIKENPWF